MIDTPIAEEGFVGAAIGAAWMGERPVVELQFADFVTCPFDPIVTVAAKTHWRSGQPIPLVIRCPTGGGVRGGPFHASSPEGWFVGTAGAQGRLPRDGRGRLRAPARGDRRPRPGALLRAQGALPPPPRPPPRRPGSRTPIGARARRARGHATRRSSPTARASRPRSRRPSGSARTSRCSTCAPSGRSTTAAMLASVEKTSRVLVLQEAARRPAPRATCSRWSRATGFELLDAPPALHAPPGHARCRSRPSSRTPTCRRSSRRAAELERAPCLLTPCARPSPSVDAPTRIALFRLVLLQRLFEERVLALYRQGRIPGSVYDGRGQEAVAAAAGLALGPDDVVAPLNRELAATSRAASRPPTPSATSSGRATRRRAAATATCTSASRRAASSRSSRCSATSRRSTVGRGARVQAARRAAGRADVPRRGRLLGRRHARGAQPGRACGRCPAVFVLQRNQYSYSTPVARQMVEPDPRRADPRRLVDPCATVDGTDALAALDAVRRAVERARDGARPAGGRGGHAADPRPRRARRRALRAGGAARGVRDA